MSKNFNEKENTFKNVFWLQFSLLRKVALIKEYSSLDRQEFRICCLTYVKLTSLEIVLIMELKVNTVQMKGSSINKTVARTFRQ